MLAGDILIFSVAYILATSLLFGTHPYLQNTAYYSGLLPLIIVIMGLMLNVNGLYTIGNKRFAEILLSLFAANLCTYLLVLVLSFFLFSESSVRLVLLLTSVLQFLLLSVWRYSLWRVERRLHDARRLLLIGSEEECEHIFRRLQIRPELDMHLKYISTDFSKEAWQGAAGSVDILMIAPGVPLKAKAKIIDYCYSHGKEVLLVPDMFEVFVAQSSLDKIDDIPVFRPKSLRPSLEERVLKRTLDIALSLIGLVCALPFLLFAAVTVKLFDPGPLLYSQVRVGKDGREFRVYKIRTMRVDAEKYTGPMLAQENDPRITPVGRFLRATRIDELPQIWNVLTGDMSIVGPRPERPVFVQQFIEENPAYAYRHNVKPGITGLAQVYGKYNTTPFDKLVYDLMYVQNCGLVTDLTVIIQTVRVLFMKSATEGAGGKKKEIDIAKYDVGNNIYGDF